MEANSIGAMMAQEDVFGVEHAVYYLSKNLLPYEEIYSPIEKMCLAVIWTTKKLRHHHQSYQYVNKKLIKGRAVAEFLAPHPIENDEPWDFKFPDEGLAAISVQGWTMYFDGADNQKGAGVGVLPITPEGEHIPLAKKLNFELTNNMTGYEACIFGLEALKAVNAKNVQIYGDFMLVVYQAKGEWEVREERLKPYHDQLTSLLFGFESCIFSYLLREEN
ncbi:uncharacterized protein LOC126665987 [Mercurialis annua]|uniref:uncharacterized protein LOC126665987 n=1 Tax=Mercurialis annua TaxID=3986 RepID=UPI00215E4E9B|nr:uncharacterized protein LOC126665987 [Mercurialis annua]